MPTYTSSATVAPEVQVADVVRVSCGLTTVFTDDVHPLRARQSLTTWSTDGSGIPVR